MNDTARNDHSPWAVFLIFFRLGLTSFGGQLPIWVTSAMSL